MDSITFLMKPAPFQFGIAGCICPVVSTARTMRVRLPGSGKLKVVAHCRKLYLP
jgi:hypothetical protein